MVPRLDASARAFLSHLDALGVALFVMTPSSRKREYDYPSGWQHFAAEGNAERLAAWRPCYGIGAVMGGAVVVFDVDL